MKYKFRCNRCDKEFFQNVRIDTKKVKCECKASASKVFTPFEGSVRGTFGELH